MAELKTKKGAGSVSAYIKAIKDDELRIDCQKLLKVFADVTNKKPTLWDNGVIGFGTYHYASERSSQAGEWFLTGFAPRKQNLTVYIMTGLKDNKALVKKLGPNKLSGGSCLYIKHLDDINITVLKKLIRQSIVEMKKKYTIT